MKIKYLHSALMIAFFCSCSSPSEDSSKRDSIKTVEIAGRDEGNSQIRPLIYRIKVPSSWVQQNPSNQTSLVDTTKAIVEFFIKENNQQIRITIHNFPSNTMSQRIAPMAQIKRWQRQFQSLEPTTVSIKPQAWGGYYGFLLEGIGLLQGARITILGWALQLATEHYQALSHPDSSIIALRYRQMRGDITIKAVGPTPLMHKYREDMITFARSFQLIDDIP